MWDLPRPGLEPVSPALAGRFSTTAPPGKPLKFLILSEPWLPPFHFALGPANYVARRAFDRIFYLSVFSPHFLPLLDVLGTMLRPKPCQEKEESLGDGGLDPSFDSQPQPLRLGVCVFF